MKMKLAQAQELVKNTKYLVWSEDESRRLQEKLFEIGCEWADLGKKVKHTEHPFLYVNDNMKLSYSFKGIFKCFEESKKRYMPTEDILNIEIDTKPKFDPKTLQPFDKVLVKSRVSNEWFPYFFESFKESHYITIGGLHWDFCIPYNDETKHLSRTSNEAPEFYKLD